MRIALATSLLLWTMEDLVWAQSAADKAAADTLFNEGKRLIVGGEIETACAKFEASLSRFAQLGTQLALASCYERLGKTASAWGAFRAAASASVRAHDEQRQRFAEEHAAALELRLSRLVIKLEPGYRIDGLEIKRDGVVVTQAELDLPVPVDPGDHVIEAIAPGWVAWSTTVAVVAMPGVVEVIVPALGKAPVKIEEPKPESLRVVQTAPVAISSPSNTPRGRRFLAYGSGGGGIVLVGTSLIFGVVASSRWNAAHSHCRDNMCNQVGFDMANGARTMGNLATGTFIVGAAAIAASAFLFITASPADGDRATRASPTTPHVAPTVGSTQVGLVVQGAF